MTNYVLRGLYTMEAYNTAPPGVSLDEDCWASVKIGELPDKAYHSIRLNLPSSWVKTRTTMNGEQIMTGTAMTPGRPVYPKQYFVYTIVEPNQEPEPGEDEVRAIHILIKAPNYDSSKYLGEATVSNVIITFSPSGVVVRDIEDAECSQLFKSPNLTIMSQINYPFPEQNTGLWAGLFSAYYGDSDDDPVKGYLWAHINGPTVGVNVSTYKIVEKETEIASTTGIVIGDHADVGYPYLKVSSEVSGIEKRLDDVQATLQSGSFISR